MKKVLSIVGVLVLIGAIASAAAGGNQHHNTGPDRQPAVVAQHAKPEHKPKSDPTTIVPGSPQDPANAATHPSPAVRQGQSGTTPGMAIPNPFSAPKPKPKPKPAPPAMTASQEQAVGSADDYLSGQAFSEQGLIDQLSSQSGEGFSKADAIYAVNHIHVDWNEQAVKSAKSYLDSGHFSRQGLIDQLSSHYGEGFTLAQAEYGVSHAYGS